MAAAWHFNLHVVHIASIVLVWTIWGFFANTGLIQVFAEEIGSTFSIRKTVYDVSQVIRSKETPNQYEILPEDFYVRDVHTSANYYFVANDAAADDFCWEDTACEWFGIKGISIIFNHQASSADMLAVADVSIYNTTILNMLKEKSSIHSVTVMLNEIRRCEDTPYFINKYFVERLKISSIKRSIEVGIEYSDEYLKRCAEVGIPRLEYLGHTILRIHVSPMTTMLSYGVFSREVHVIIEENRKLVRELCPKCTPYIRLHNEKWNTTISADNFDNYNALLTTYLEAFSKQNNGDEMYIFSPILKRSNFVPNNAFLKQSVTLFYAHIEGEELESVSLQDKHLLACAHQNLVTLLLSNIQNIFAYDPFLEVLSSLSATCNSSTENAEISFNLPPNTSLSLWLTTFSGELEIDKQFEKLVEILRNNPAGIKIAKVFVYAEDFKKTESLTKVVNLAQSQSIDIGCISSLLYREIQTETANISAILSRTIHKCITLTNLSTEILVSIKADIRNAEDVLTLLVRLDQAKQHFEILHPDKTLILYIWPSAKEIKESLYCSPEVKQFEEYYQTIYSFANIQGWSRLVVRSDHNEFGFWSRVRTDEKIEKLELKFPVLFRTNAPPTADKELSMIYPCIHRTRDARKSNINFLGNQYSGATFQTNLREKAPLLTGELETLLELAMKRFPSVEIIAANQSDFKRVKTVIGTNAPSHKSLLNHSMPFVYVAVPLEEVYDLRQEINKVLSNKHVAVHISNWESSSYRTLNLLNLVEIPFTPNFGVVVQNCGHEMDTKITKLESLPIFPHVGYIVCNTSPVLPDNTGMDWMEKNLGTIFYIKSYMEHFLSNGRGTRHKVEVMFRLNYICSKTDEMEKFLRFLNDVNQHSAAYKIRYFLVHAFEGEVSADCVNSWWRPDSYTDLSNISTFINREDEHAGREARIPYEPPPVSIPEQSSNVVYFFAVVAPIFVLLLLALLAQWLYQRKLKAKILTQSEVRQFYNGGEQSNLSSADGDYLDFGNMKFPKNYEIPRKDIQTEEMIGSGQFGVVHRGILKESTEVAIKIPRSDCGKEQFKSTLSELKILCYIGEHLNIVSFLGACTKGIANGNLRIVIEYCKNGCLLKYLRQNQENSEEDSSLSLFELCGFSLQIASGMEYIAEKRVIHGDLAARNVLLTSEMTCKIADFGLSRRLYEMTEYVKSSQEPLPWRWMAPESLRNMEFTIKSDVWSYGITLWEIFSFGMVPYPGLNWSVNYVSELENGLRMGKASHATDEIHSKMLDCWNMNSEARPTFTELKEYFVGIRNEEYLTLNKI